MEEGLRVWFDPKGDFLEVNIGKPKKGFFKNVGDDVFLRVDEKGNILGFAVLNATKRLEKVREVKLPVRATFTLISEI